MAFLKKTQVKVTPVPEEVPISIQRRDRAFSDEEERYFKCAMILSLEAAPIIKPIPGTLCYFLRNENKRAVINLVKRGIRRAIKIADVKTDELRKKLVILVDAYAKLDPNSQERPDVFDYLCPMYDVDLDVFWEAYQKQAASFSKEMAEHDINIHTPAVINAIAKKALGDGNSKSAELFMRIAGLDKPAPLVSIEDNSVYNTQNNLNVFSNFSNSVRRSEKEIEKAEQLLLTEQRQEYIDAEYSDVKEEKVA